MYVWRTPGPGACRMQSPVILASAPNTDNGSRLMMGDSTLLMKRSRRYWKWPARIPHPSSYTAVVTALTAARVTVVCPSLYSPATSPPVAGPIFS
jgi:hypothetical protein